MGSSLAIYDRAHPGTSLRGYRHVGQDYFLDESWNLHDDAPEQSELLDSSAIELVTSVLGLAGIQLALRIREGLADHGITHYARKLAALAATA